MNGTSRSGLMRKMENGERNVLLNDIFLKKVLVQCILLFLGCILTYMGVLSYNLGYYD